MNELTKKWVIEFLKYLPNMEYVCDEYVITEQDEIDELIEKIEDNTPLSRLTHKEQKHILDMCNFEVNRFDELKDYYEEENTTIDDIKAVYNDVRKCCMKKVVNNFDIEEELKNTYRCDNCDKCIYKKYLQFNEEEMFCNKKCFNEWVKKNDLLREWSLK